MNAEIAAFFAGKPRADALWRLLEARCAEQLSHYEVRVSKTQLSLFSGMMFACLSLPRRKSQQGIIVTFGLPVRVQSERIWQATEPYPNRWTHHVLVSDPAEIDDELLNWLAAAQVFAQKKKR